MTLRVIFMGTPEFAVPTLAEIVGAGHEVVAVYTQPPRPAGRGMDGDKIAGRTVGRGCGTAGVRRRRASRARPSRVSFAGHGADVAVVVAYGLILPQAVLEAPRRVPQPARLGAAALARRRAHPARGHGGRRRDRRHGDAHGGGARYGSGVPGRAAGNWSGRDHRRVARPHGEVGAGLMVRALAALERGSLTLRRNPRRASPTRPRSTRPRARLDFARSAVEVHNKIRGLSPFPGAYFEVSRDGKTERIKVLRSLVVDAGGEPGTVLDASLTIACGNKAVRFLELQRPGKKPMRADELLRGFALPAGAVINQG